MHKTIVLKDNKTFIVVAHACPKAIGEFQWYLVDDPNSDKEYIIDGEEYESIVLSNDVINDTYKNKWLCCKCNVNGEIYSEGCIFLSDDFIEMISKNQFDEIQVCDEDGNIRTGFRYFTK